MAPGRYIEYLCLCGCTVSGEVDVFKSTNFEYLRCPVCCYPCSSLPNLSESMSVNLKSHICCPFCEQNSSDMEIICVIDHEKDVFLCSGCDGLVPLQDLVDYLDMFVRLIERLESSSSAALTPKKIKPVSQLSVSPNKLSLPQCLNQHFLQCYLLNGKLLASCSDCDLVNEVSHESDDTLAKLVDLIQLCECNIDDYRWIVLEADNSIHLKCPVCKRQFHGPNWNSLKRRYTKGHVNWGKYHDKKQINSLDDMQVGDHIVYKRGLYDHHAIVTSVDRENGTYHQIHYTEGNNNSFASPMGIFQKAVVREDEFRLSPLDDPMFVIIYPPLDCFPMPRVIERATSRLGEQCYNLLTSNCEHLARWCKVGEARSGQVDKALAITRHTAAHVAPVMLRALSTQSKGEIIRNLLQAGFDLSHELYRYAREKTD